MSELTRTGIFAGVALIVSLVAVVTRPTLPLGTTGNVKVGGPLFPELTDLNSAASLEVTERKDSGKVETFKAVKSDAGWVIASYKNYPADAADRLKSAAELFLGAKVLDAQGRERNKDGSEMSDAEYYETYGVVAPDTATTTKDTKGVGTLITLRNAKGEKLANVIVGAKAAAEGDPSGAESKIRFVRRGDEPTVYVAEFDLAKLSTNYADWMEKDLLKQKTATGGQSSLSDKLERATLRDYVLNDLTPGPSPAQALLEMKFTWKQADFKWQLDEVAERRGAALTPFVMLASEELNTGRLDDLKSALDTLKFVEAEPRPEGGLDANLKATPKLMRDNAAAELLMKRGFTFRDGELIGSGGELVLLTKDGVEYVLRFGSRVDQPLAPGAKAGDEAKKGRYLFIAARANTASIPKPDLAPLPDAGPAAPVPEPKEGPEVKEPEGKEPKEPKAADIAKKKADRERIEKENKRKQDEYDQKLKDAERTVNELNFRFGDWYYLVDEDSYNKLHLSKYDLVREKKDAKETGFEVDAFRDLEGGPKKKEVAPPGPPGGGFPGGFPGGGFPGGFPGGS